ncbi:MAG: hypothetical protein ABIH59_02935 [archaeon]
MNKRAEIPWKAIIIIAIILGIVILSRVSIDTSSTKTNSEQNCYYICESDHYDYDPTTEKCQCQTTLLNNIINWILNKN